MVFTAVELEILLASVRRLVEFPAASVMVDVEDALLEGLPVELKSETRPLDAEDIAVEAVLLLDGADDDLDEEPIPPAGIAVLLVVEIPLANVNMLVELPMAKVMFVIAELAVPLDIEVILLDDPRVE